MRHLDKFEQEVTSWAGVSVHPHRFGGREFRFGKVEIGHIHAGGILDIPFPRAIRDALLDEGLVEKHHWVPNSGWITYHVQSDEDCQHALWLIRLSYLRYELKNVADPRALLEGGSAQLQLSSRFRLLLEPFIRQPILESIQPLTA